MAPRTNRDTRALIDDIKDYTSPRRERYNSKSRSLGTNAKADHRILSTMSSLLTYTIQKDDLKMSNIVEKLYDALKYETFDNLRTTTIKFTNSALIILLDKITQLELTHRATRSELNYVEWLHDILETQYNDQIAHAIPRHSRKFQEDCTFILARLQELIEWMEASLALRDRNIRKTFHIMDAENVRYYLPKGEPEDCAVCYDTKLDSSENFAILSGCSHVFCFRCISTLRKAGDQKCPMCRQESRTALKSRAVRKMLAVRDWMLKNHCRRCCETSGADCRSCRCG
ncbi:uncharacterized protein LOC125179156 [Hyalella azteca]|uniref:Uncharacterized protein LOC125179156 n=1 Tax=Hyalella azteca TaxID=294128 RepID=A0A979FT90_HYAAZ|nr:uncharacterized protein LOC125179156 [Hyalella azteca]